MNDSLPSPTLGLHARKTAKTLGWLGILPFLALATVSALGGPDWAGQALIAYAALILSFMAGTWWSDLIHSRRTPHKASAHLLVSNVLVLMAWPALWFPMAWASWWLAALFTAHLILDAPWRTNNGPAWYRHMRLGISTVVVTLLVLSGAIGLGIQFGLGNGA